MVSREITVCVCVCVCKQVGLEEKQKREEEVVSFQSSHQQACSLSQRRSVDIIAAYETKKVCSHVISSNGHMTYVVNHVTGCRT